MSARKKKSAASGSVRPGKQGKQAPDAAALERAAKDAKRQARIDRLETGERKKFNAPLIAGAIVVLAVIVLVAYSVLKPGKVLTVDALNSPAVAALGAGDALYAPNSKEALTENARFGYLPAPQVALTADKDVVVADAATAQKRMGLAQPVARTGTKDFLAAKIAPFDGAQNAKQGTPLTWHQALDELGKATVFNVQIDSVDVVEPFLADVDSAGRADGLIVRSNSLQVLRAVSQGSKGAIATLYEQPAAHAQAAPDAAVKKAAELAELDGRDASAAAGDGAQTPEDLKRAGVTMVAVPAGADDLKSWTDAGLKVWVTGVPDKNRLDSLAGAGVFGALAHNPFAIQPSAVKTD